MGVLQRKFRSASLPGPGLRFAKRDGKAFGMRFSRPPPRPRSIHRYVSAPWNERKFGGGYFGSGECSVASLVPGPPRLHRWVGATGAENAKTAPMMFVSVSKERIAFGGGMSGHALELDAELDHGTTGPSRTFGNDIPLLPETQFRCAIVEVWFFGGDDDV